MLSGRDGGPVWSESGGGEGGGFVGTLATIRIAGASVGERFALIEFLFPGLASPPRHTHPQDESYIVVEGRLTIDAGGERFELRAGGCAVVPMGVAHTFRVDSDTARGLVLSTPARLDRRAREGSVRATAPPLPPAGPPRLSPEDLAGFSPPQGQVTPGPPLGPDD